jgi:hypothetical protein
MPLGRSSTTLAVLTGLFVAMAYVFAAGPTFYWLDSSELVASGWGLGVSHPPGHALHGLLARLFCLLPVGTISFRVTLASAAQAAAAAGLMVAVSVRVLHRLHRPVDPGLLALAAVTAGLSLGLSYALWFQAVRAEVYALNLLVLVAGVELVLRWDDRGDGRHLLAAALLAALGLTNHHFLVLLALPAVAAFWLTRRGSSPTPPRWRRVVPGLILSGALGLTTLAYLPLRASQAPMVNWGSPTTLDRIAWVVSAEAFRGKSAARAAAETLAHRGMGGVFSIFRGFAWDSLLGLVPAFLALLGLYLLWRRRGTWRLGLLFTGLVGLNLLSPVLVGFDPYNPDAYGYLCVAVAFLCPPLAVALAVLLGILERQLGRSTVAVAAVVCLGLVVGQVARNLPRVDLRAHWEADETARQQLRDLPPGALVFSSYFETVFNLWALRTTEDSRPDIDLIHRNFLGYPGTAEQLQRRLPRLSGEARRWTRAGRLLTRDLARLEARRPVLVEYDLNVPPDLVECLSPGGLLLPFDNGGSRSGESEHIERVQRWHRLVAPGARRDTETRRAVVWTHYLLARYGCQRRLRRLGRYHLSRARELAPRDRTLDQLGRRCGPITLWK